jgi:hypothetical protein
VAGKFLVAGGEKLYVRGATYGTFARDPLGHAYPSRDVVHDDFHRMASIGLNSVRTYTVPPRWLLDEAHDAGLRVLVGIPWEQHIAFLDEPERAAGIEARVRGGVRSCAGHPALLGFALGNEIPSQVVRWTGRRRIERHIRRLYHAAKAEDPGALVTYVNYPSTEYLQLPFLDFVCFNVYLESRDTLAGYVARLHNLAGDRPLIMGELGIDSIRAGEYGQACGLESQIRTALEGGCAGGFVFSYTDEWNRGGHEIEDWAFGITTREREPKPALTTVQRAFSEVPFAADTEWPPMSVIVCAHNEERTIADCLDGLGELDYPDYEVIVVDDGSSDLTSEIASRFDVQLIRTPNQGLSRARNTGIEASRGEIIAFTDADARPDTHWLKYLAASGMAVPRIAWRTRQAAPSTCCWPTRRRSTFRAATWRFAAVHWKPWTASTPGSEWPAMMWTCAGDCRSRGGRWASARPPLSGIIHGPRSGRTGGNRRDTVGRRRCWRRSGRRSTTRPATSRGGDGCTAALCPGCWQAAAASITGSGAPLCFRPISLPIPVSCGPWPALPNGTCCWSFSPA